MFKQSIRIRLSAWITVQALMVSTLPAPAWAAEVAQDHLRAAQRESASGLEEIKEALAGLEQGAGLEEPPQRSSRSVARAAAWADVQSVEEALQRYFRKDAGRDEEIQLEQFLSERWAGQIRQAAAVVQSTKGSGKDRRRAEEALQAAVRRQEEQIEEFVHCVEEDRRQAGLLKPKEGIGPYQLPPLDPSEIPAPGQRSGSGDLEMEIPSDRAYYELERLRLMARAAIQRALGRQVVVNIGIGFVGTAVSTATAAEGHRDYGKIPAAQKRKLHYRGPLEGRQDAYFTIAYQRPSPASAYKVPAINRGVSPIAAKDPMVGQKIRETTQKGTLTATPLSGAIALADTVMLETELHAAKVLPTHLEHSRVKDEATVRLIRQVGSLMRPDALIIVESTIGPGFLRGHLLPAVNEELQRRNLLPEGQNANLAHAFQRLEPGPRWYSSLLEQERVGAGVTEEAGRKLEDYFQTVGFRYRILSRVEAVEFMKTLENAWRFGLLELMNSFVRAAEIVGVDGFEVARLIARARPTTHHLITAIPNIQPGGYCVPKELIIIVTSLSDNFSVSPAEIMEIFNTRFFSAVASDFRGRVSVARAAEALAGERVRLDDARVHVLGIAYSDGVSDTRMSGVERAVREFAAVGVAPSHVTITDPYAAVWPEVQQQQLTSPESWGHGLPNQQGLSSLQVQRTGDPYSTLNPDQDVVLMGTRHREYVGRHQIDRERERLRSERKTADLKRLEGAEGLDPVRMTARMMGREGKVLIDTFDFFSDEDYKLFLALGWQVRALGKGHLADLEQGLTLEERIRAVEALLTEFQVLRSQPGVDEDQLRQAVETARAKRRLLKARVKEARARKRAYRRMMARQELAAARDQLRRALEWLDDEDPRILRLQRRVRLAMARRDGRQSEVERLEREQQQDVADYMEQSVVRPAARRAAGILKRSSFMQGVPARYLLTKQALPAAEERRVDAAAAGPVRRSELFLLAQYVDQAFHMMDYLLLETLTPEEMSEMLSEIRHREEAAHPERVLKSRRRFIPYWVYGNDGKVERRTRVTVDAVRPFRWRTDLRTGDLVVETDPDHWMNITLKQLPDLLRTDIPDEWGRYFVLVRPKLVPVAKDAAMRAYPPGFDDLPPELALWLARDVVGKGYTLTTLSGRGAVEQDKILLAMVIDPHGAGSGRAGHLVWADSHQPVVSITPEGWEIPISLKGVGLFVGGDDRFPHAEVETLGTTTGRRVTGGMTKTGALGHATLAQVPGFVPGVGSEHGLTALSTTDAYHNGLAPRLAFGMNFRFKYGRGAEYFLSARQDPDTARMGWRFRGAPFDAEAETDRAAEVLGWNAAELLAHLPQPAIHIALSLDNVQANGYFTDPDSIVPPLYRERNPYGALFKYFGFAMQQTVMGWKQMKASREGTSFELEDRHMALLRRWLRGFMGHLLESGKVRRAPLEQFNRLSRLGDQEFPAALRNRYGVSTNREAFQLLANDLINTLWNYYVAYEVLKNRLQFGYNHTVESTYTGTANEKWDPSSEEDARRYLRSQREILEISQRLIREGVYPPIAFDFDRALQEVGQREQRLNQLADQQADDFREVYPLNFHRPEAAQIVSVLDLSAVQAGARSIHIAGEIPLDAPLVEKEVVTAAPKQAAAPKSGLEERPLKDAVNLQEVGQHVQAAPQSLAKIRAAKVVLVTLDAGLGTRFERSIPEGAFPEGTAPPKMAALLRGVPIGMGAKRSVEAQLGWPVVSVVGHRAQEVMEGYRARSHDGLVFVPSEDPAGGTGYALYHAAAVPNLLESNPVVVATVGDRPLYDAQLFQQALSRFRETKADLVIGVIHADSPKSAHGKGRIVRLDGQVAGIVEQADINAIRSGGTRLGHTRDRLEAIREVNGSLYVMRARLLFSTLGELTSKTAQGQYYVTDLVRKARGQGRRIETVEVPAFLTTDVTTYPDLLRLERELPGSGEDPTLARWVDILRDEAAAPGLLAPHYLPEVIPQKREQILRWIGGLQALRTSQGQEAFQLQRPAIVSRSPGRFLFPVTGRHLDYLGGQGGSIGSPTDQETVLFAQEADGLGGKVEIYQAAAPDSSVAAAYPQGGLGARTVDLGSPLVTPDRPIRTLDDWDTWAGARADERRQARTPAGQDPNKSKLNYADDLAAAVVAFARTDLGDPSGRIRVYLNRLAVEGKGLRFALASDLPTGGGLSSSSAVAIGFAQALAALAEAELTQEQLVNFGYAERFYAGTQGGVKDHAHIVNDTGFLGVEPTRTIATMSPVPGASVLLLDSGISRDNAPSFSAKLAGRGNDEQNIKGRTSIGYALANLWLRHIHPELTERIAPDAKNPDGYLRNLVPSNPGGMSAQEVYRLLREIPAEGLTRRQMGERMPEFRADLDRLFYKRPEPPEPYALREMALFFFAEESRNWEVARTLRALSAEEISPDQAFRHLVEIGRAAHNGDRVTRYRITPGDEDSLTVTEIGWNWHLSDETLDRYLADPNAEEAVLWRQAGRMERSLEPLDRLVDLVEYFNQSRGGNAAVAVVMGAGLGGTVGVFARDKVMDELAQFLETGYYQPLGLSHGPVIRARAGKGASVFTVQLAAGLGEGPPSPVQSWSLMSAGLPGWWRLAYTLADGSRWLGGAVRDDVPPGKIAATAYLSPYSYAEGKGTRLAGGVQIVNSGVSDTAMEQNAQMTRSFADSALLHGGAVAEEAVLGPAHDVDEWSFSKATASDPALSVRNHSVTSGDERYQVELGRGATAREAVVQSAAMGDNSRVQQSAVIISRWGEQTTLGPGIKSLLAVAARGHADLAGVRHSADGSEQPAALEVAESAYMGLDPEEYPGIQVRERRTGYTEVTVTNRVALASTSDGGETLHFEFLDLPPLTLFGDYGIFSIYGGAPNPESIMTDGQPTPRVIRRLTGAPGEQSSQHGRIAAEPLSIVQGFTNVIGRRLALPALEDPRDFATEPETTRLAALSVMGVDAQLGLNGFEAQGQSFSGEARGQLSRAAGVSPWVFLYAPEAIFALMGQLVQGLPDGGTHRYNDLPQRLLRSGLALTQWRLKQELAKLKPDGRVADRLRRYEAGYRALIDSGVWMGDWVLEDGLYRPNHWSKDDGQWRSGKVSFDAIHETAHPLASEVPYHQFSPAQLLALPDGVERPDWSGRLSHFLRAGDLDAGPMTPLEQLQPVPDEPGYKEREIIGQDDRYYYTIRGGRIAREIPLEHIAPTAVIGTGTVLTGAGTTVGEESRLFMVVAEDLQAGQRVQLRAAKAGKGAMVKDKVALTWAKLGAGATIGAGSTGVYVGAGEGSVMAPNTTFESFSVVVRSRTAPGNVVGVTLMDSTTLPGFMGRHLSTTVEHLEHQPVRFQAGGTTYDLGAAALNVAGGVWIAGTAQAPVRMSAAYPLSLATIRPGEGKPSSVGAFSVLKNAVELDGEILPFTFHAFSNLPPEDPRFAMVGRHNDRIAGALDLTGIFMRNFIYRTKKALWDDLASQGLSPDEILQHPRLFQADYMVEALIVETFRQVLQQLGTVEESVPGQINAATQPLLEFIDQDLAQIAQRDQTVLGARTAEARARLSDLIQNVRQRLNALPADGLQGKISASGHTAGQLMEGLKRLAQNLDGRWRMRHHTFTEVEWRYVDYDETGAARDTWVPVPNAAGLEEMPVIALPAEVAAKSIMIFTPETAGAISVLSAFRPAPGESLQVAVIVADDVQQAAVEAGLEEAGLTLALPMVHLARTGGTLAEAIVDLQVRAWGQALETFVVSTMADLLGLGRFLKIPDASRRSFESWLERQLATHL